MKQSQPIAEKQYGKLSVSIFSDAESASISVAANIAKLIRTRQVEGKNVVLGLATGATPVQVYTEWVRMHREEGLSFHNVITFNLDEYYPMASDAAQSYVTFMNKHLFDHIDIDPEQIHIPDGTLAMGDVEEYCQAYEKKIVDMGGIDVQLLGIGRTGHVGFNEPGSTPDTLTRLVQLNDLTRNDAAKDFGGKEHVPAQAITMGIGTIFQAREIILMAWGEKKAEIVAKAIHGDISSDVPATYLQLSDHVKYVLDTSAALLLG